AAGMMPDTTVPERIVGSAWPNHFNKVVAEVQQKNIEAVGMPQWSDADQTLAKALQQEIKAKGEGLKVKVKPLEGPKDVVMGGGADDGGAISCNVRMVHIRYPATVLNLPGHSWDTGIVMATPMAHKRSTAGAEVQALNALAFRLKPDLRKQGLDYFNTLQTNEVKYQPLINPSAQ